MRLADLDLRTWAGVPPARFATGEPVPSTEPDEGIPVPGYLTDYGRLTR